METLYKKIERRLESFRRYLIKEEERIEGCIQSLEIKSKLKEQEKKTMEYYKKKINIVRRFDRLIDSVELGHVTLELDFISQEELGKVKSFLGSDIGSQRAENILGIVIDITAKRLNKRNMKDIKEGIKKAQKMLDRRGPASLPAEIIAYSKMNPDYDLKKIENDIFHEIGMVSSGNNVMSYNIENYKSLDAFVKKIKQEGRFSEEQQKEISDAYEKKVLHEGLLQHIPDLKASLSGEKTKLIKSYLNKLERDYTKKLKKCEKILGKYGLNQIEVSIGDAGHEKERDIVEPDLGREQQSNSLEQNLGKDSNTVKSRREQSTIGTQERSVAEERERQEKLDESNKKDDIEETKQAIKEKAKERKERIEGVREKLGINGVNYYEARREGMREGRRDMMIYNVDTLRTSIECERMSVCSARSQMQELMEETRKLNQELYGEKFAEKWNMERFQSGDYESFDIPSERSKEVLLTASVQDLLSECESDGAKLDHAAIELAKRIAALKQEKERLIGEKDHRKAFADAKDRYNELSSLKKFMDKITGKQPDWDKLEKAETKELKSLYQPRNKGQDR